MPGGDPSQGLDFVTPLEIALAVLIVFFSIVLHEISHGAVAYSFGDPTAKERGRLTLNPFSHIDWVGTVALPAALYLLGSGVVFGWAKPVPFDPRYFKHRTLGTLAVALAGPLTNFFLALLFAFLLKAIGADQSSATKVLELGLGINFFLALFNLLPIPPLDGSKIVGALLPRTLQPYFFSVERAGIIIIVALLFSGVLSKVLSPVYTYGLRWLTNF